MYAHAMSFQELDNKIDASLMSVSKSHKLTQIPFV